jgi:hypothetical protein
MKREAIKLDELSLFFCLLLDGLSIIGTVAVNRFSLFLFFCFLIAQQ